MVKPLNRFFIVLFIAVLSLLSSMNHAALADSGTVSVLTNRYDISRSGTNLNETLLNTSNVNVNQFGKLFCQIAFVDMAVKTVQAAWCG